LPKASHWLHVFATNYLAASCLDLVTLAVSCRAS
jgi:hypothetical protein